MVAGSGSKVGALLDASQGVIQICAKDRVGESDAKGEGPKDKAITPDDVAATFYAALGIDSRKEYHTRTGRPIMIVRNGAPLKELVS